MFWILKKIFMVVAKWLVEKLIRLLKRILKRRGRRRF